ncbi:VIT1/CCC1 transporter family protein [Sandarakinorhabdus sp. DWP1-3-1]|uniref:VIT1/CCC1 transporter family protein n=1 Tax=Sandarakinorhabdus sp. DWP1-3-1 TaxID=2804627 RepID=UPI003CEAC897
MARTPRHREDHRLGRSGWLRAAVLGANDGILSTASLIVGVAAAATPAAQVALTGVAGLVAGALSMAAGEYVSVSSQADAERQDLAREAAEQVDDPEGERRELEGIYRTRGLPAELAQQVAGALMAHDALGAHARDELGLSEALAARPVQAALTSAASFAAGAALPLAAAVLAPRAGLSWAVTGVSIAALAVLGLAGARLGGVPVRRPTLRVMFWGILAMAGTALIGRLFGAVV